MHQGLFPGQHEHFVSLARAGADSRRRMRRIAVTSCVALPLIVGASFWSGWQVAVEVRGANVPFVTIPPARADTDGTGIGSGPGFTAKCQSQVLVGASLLHAVHGRDIEALWLRRDGSHHRLVAGRLSLAVSIGPSAVSAPTQASHFFSDNCRSRTAVFQGTVDLPAAPELPSRNAAQWAAPDAIRIAFSTPYRYTGGDLCIEFVGEPVAPSTTTWWPIDLESDGVKGNTLPFGASCGPWRSATTWLSGADPTKLRPGATARFFSLGSPGATVLFLLAAQPLGQPFDLAFLGAPGCLLQVQPAVTAFAAVGAPANLAGPGAANWHVHLAHETAFFGAAFAVQAIHAQGLTITSTNAVIAQLASTAAMLDAAMVSSRVRVGTPHPTIGEVEVGRMPVLRFELL